MSTPRIVTGDNVSLQVTLKRDNQTFTIAPGATVEASIVDLEHKEVYVAAVAQSNTAPGADWANSLVIVEFAPADTADVTYQGEATLEIQVDDSGKTTFFAGVVLISGTIA